MTPEERKEFDELKHRVAFLEELCVNYHNVLNELRGSYRDEVKLFKDHVTREAILLHTPHFCELMRNGNMGFERNVG